MRSLIRLVAAEPCLCCFRCVVHITSLMRFEQRQHPVTRPTRTSHRPETGGEATPTSILKPPKTLKSHPSPSVYFQRSEQAKARPDTYRQRGEPKSPPTPPRLKPMFADAPKQAAAASQKPLAAAAGPHSPMRESEPRSETTRFAIRIGGRHQCVVQRDRR